MYVVMEEDGLCMWKSGRQLQQTCRLEVLHKRNFTCFWSTHILLGDFFLRRIAEPSESDSAMHEEFRSKLFISIFIYASNQITTGRALAPS